MSAPGWLGLLGLGCRAGTTVIGTAGVRAALKRDDLALVVVAGDGGRRTDEKVGRLARARAVAVVVGPDARTLGQAVGRSAVQAVGVRDPRLAAGIKAKSGSNV